MCDQLKLHKIPQNHRLFTNLSNASLCFRSVGNAHELRKSLSEYRCLARAFLRLNMIATSLVSEPIQQWATSAAGSHISQVRAACKKNLSSEAVRCSHLSLLKWSWASHHECGEELAQCCWHVPFRRGRDTSVQGISCITKSPPLIDLFFLDART